jgi:hypothetical protein
MLKFGFINLDLVKGCYRTTKEGSLLVGFGDCSWGRNNALL